MFVISHQPLQNYMKSLTCEPAIFLSQSYAFNTFVGTVFPFSNWEFFLPLLFIIITEQF